MNQPSLQPIKPHAPYTNGTHIVTLTLLINKQSTAAEQRPIKYSLTKKLYSPTQTTNQYHHEQGEF